MTSILNRLWRSRARFLLVVVWITSLGVTFLAGAIAFRQRDQIRRLIGTAVRGQVIRSEYYNIAVKMLPIPGEGRDGGIEALDAFAPQDIQSFVMATPLRLREKLMMRCMIRNGLSRDAKAPLLFMEHHESHAASAFFPSPFAEAAILTLDGGVGEWATSTWGTGRGNKIELKQHLEFPHSLYLLYSVFTYYCGFKVNSGEYKLMGLEHANGH